MLDFSTRDESIQWDGGTGPLSHVYWKNPCKIQNMEITPKSSWEFNMLVVSLFSKCS